MQLFGSDLRPNKQMDLKGFLAVTTDLLASLVRAAMVRALADKPLDRSYVKFYCRVLRELGSRTCDERA